MAVLTETHPRLIVLVNANAAKSIRVREVEREAGARGGTLGRVRGGTRGRARGGTRGRARGRGMRQGARRDARQDARRLLPHQRPSTYCF